MPTRNIVLTPQQDTFIAELLRGGDYQNASEAIREGLRLLKRQTEQQGAVIEGLRNGVIESLGQAARGEFAEGGAEDVVKRAFQHARSDAKV